MMSEPGFLELMNYQNFVNLIKSRLRYCIPAHLKSAHLHIRIAINLILAAALPMKKITITLFLLIGFEASFSQTHLLPKFIRKMYFDKDTTRKSSFVILPVLSSAPETGLEAGGAGLYSFYTDTLNPNTRVSNVFGYATITTKGQNRLSLSTSYWTPQNKYHFTAGVGYINFPFDFYGIGNNTLKANTDRIGQKRLKVNFSAEKKVASNFYV